MIVRSDLQQLPSVKCCLLGLGLNDRTTVGIGIMGILRATRMRYLPTHERGLEILVLMRFARFLALFLNFLAFFLFFEGILIK